MIRRRKTRPIVGAAIGIGIAARAAEKGGADFLLALNAGRLRVMGAPSMSCMLPVGDSNKQVFELGTKEIFDHVTVPTFFGACTFDPRQDVHALLSSIRRLGFAGVANFPTAIHLNGAFRAALERRGVGFGRELEMLRHAKQLGLLTFGYGVTGDEARLLAKTRPTIFCLNFGWNAGGTMGLPGRINLEEATERARSVIQAFRRLSPASICLIEGGPIVTAEDMHQVYVHAHADGYVGGSTIDRLPFEESVAQSTSSFKTITYFKPKFASRERRIITFAQNTGMAGQSQVFLKALESASNLAQDDAHVLISGEPGTGKTVLARAVHDWSKRKGGVYILDGATESSNLVARLFGSKAKDTDRRQIGVLEIEGATVIIENIDLLDLPTLAVLQSALASGFMSNISGETRLVSARIIATSNNIVSNEKAGRVLEKLFCESTVTLPPLRDRPDDIVAVAGKILELVSHRAGDRPMQISPSGYRYLFAHDWPGNIAELRMTIKRATSSAKTFSLTYADLLAAKAVVSQSRQPMSEKEEQVWILAALKRNRFRKGDAAQDLGISRRTLYNKIRKLGLAG